VENENIQRIKKIKNKMQETTVLFICSRCVTVFGFFCDRGTKGEESTSSSLNDGVSLSLSLFLLEIYA